MARRKADVQIGYRAEEEVFRLFPSHPAAAAALGSAAKSFIPGIRGMPPLPFICSGSMSWGQTCSTSSPDSEWRAEFICQNGLLLGYAFDIYLFS